MILIQLIVKLIYVVDQDFLRLLLRFEHLIKLFSF